MRKIAYLSGTRADFGLMRNTLETLSEHPGLDLSIIVTGMHLDPRFGRTVEEIEASGLRIAARLPVPMDEDSGATMARNIGRILIGLSEILLVERPDMLLLLGDRGEMLAGAIAAAHLGIAVVHVHGGERSGTIDEPVRHAVSKLAHLHAVATAGSRDRLVSMGEDAWRITVTGAPGLDGLTDIALVPPGELATSFGLSVPFALMLFHPVLQEAERAEQDALVVLDALRAEGLDILALAPNADAGAAGVRRALQARADLPGITVLTHLPRATFLAAMAGATLMIGNSSAGIIEAASFGTPVINIGSRQRLRERNANVIDAPAESDAIRAAIAQAKAVGRFPAQNIYGDGGAARRLTHLICRAQITPELLAKVNAY